MTNLNEAGENCDKRLLFLHIRGYARTGANTGRKVKSPPKGCSVQTEKSIPCGEISHQRPQAAAERKNRPAMRTVAGEQRFAVYVFVL